MQLKNQSHMFFLNRYETNTAVRHPKVLKLTTAHIISIIKGALLDHRSDYAWRINFSSGSSGRILYKLIIIESAPSDPSNSD